MTDRGRCAWCGREEALITYADAQVDDDRYRELWRVLNMGDGTQNLYLCGRFVVVRHKTGGTLLPLAGCVMASLAERDIAAAGEE